MIQKLPRKILIKTEQLGKFVISTSSAMGHEYFREPTKKEMLEKINEIIDFINGKPS